MPKNPLLHSIEVMGDCVEGQRQSFSIYSIPELGGLACLGTVYSEFDPSPDRLALFSHFESEVHVAKEIFRAAAERIKPSYLFMPPERRLYPLTARSFSYKLELASVANEMTELIAEEVAAQVAARKCNSRITDIYGFKPFYLSGEKFEEVEDVYVNSVSLIRHFDQGGRQIIAIAELAEEDEKAA